MTHEELQRQLTQAEAELAQGNYDEAERMSDQILTSLSGADLASDAAAERTSLQANAIHINGVICYERRNYNQALEHFNASLQLSNKVADDNGVAKTLHVMGHLYYDLSLYSKALDCYVNALGIHEELANKSGIATMLGEIGTVYNSLSDDPTALEYYAKALRLDEELGNKLGVSRHLGNIGNVHLRRSDYKRALEFQSQALSINEELDNKSGVAIWLGNIGNVYSALGDVPKALEYFLKARGIAQELNDKRSEAVWLGNIGNMYYNLSDYSKALECHTEALSLDEELDNMSGVANNFGNIGNVLWNLMDYPKAMEYYEKALKIDEEIGNKSRVTTLLGNIGNVYNVLSDYPKALEYYNKTIRLAEELGKKSTVALNLSNIGIVYKELSDYTKALESLQRALQMQEELGNRRESIATRDSLAVLYSLRTNPDRDVVKAEAYLKEAVTMSQELGLKTYYLHKTLAEIFELQERWQEANHEWKQYHAVKDEVLSEEAKKSAALMEYRKQIAEREKDLAVAKATADAQMSATTKLLYKVLPQSVATRMINGEDAIADYFPTVSILFADIVGFTPIASQMLARDVMSLLNYIFAEFDRIMERHGCQKIKTMGDGYMAVCGAPIPCDDHAERLANAALDLLNDIELPESLRSSLPKGSVFHLRIGLHCGPAFAGIVGEKGFVYDVYSDAVNLASRMESHGEPGRIHCSEDFKNHLVPRRQSLRFAERGAIDVKGKGVMRTYFLERA